MELAIPFGTRPNFDTALRFDSCVAGDRLPTVISSIICGEEGFNHHTSSVVHLEAAKPLAPL
jgi:hypothetical protein